MLEPNSLLSVIALLEARLLQLFNDSNLDPLIGSQIKDQNLAQALIEITDHNEEAVSKNSLDAKLIHWQTGKEIIAKDLIMQVYEEVYPIAKKTGFACFLSPLTKIIKQGNTAQNWLNQINNGVDIRNLLINEINLAEQQEKDLEDKLCELLNL